MQLHAETAQACTESEVVEVLWVVERRCMMQGLQRVLGRRGEWDAVLVSRASLLGTSKGVGEERQI